MAKFMFEQNLRLVVTADDAAAAERAVREWRRSLETHDYAAVESLARAHQVFPVTSGDYAPVLATGGPPLSPQFLPPPMPPQPCPGGILATGKRR